jgi:hypothetical protein
VTDVTALPRQRAVLATEREAGGGSWPESPSRRGSQTWAHLIIGPLVTHSFPLFAACFEHISPLRFRPTVYCVQSLRLVCCEQAIALKTCSLLLLQSGPRQFFGS